MKHPSVTTTITNPALHESSLMFKISAAVIVVFAVLAWVL